MSRFYTGIGSRNIPPVVYSKLKTVGAFLAERGFTLRSGAAKGADTAFEDGCDVVEGSKEIYLPWKGFNKHDSDLYFLTPEATILAGEYYGSSWPHVSKTTRQFMTRNMYQVTGFNLDEPSELIICWTPDGCRNRSERSKRTGGTGQAISYGSSINVPIFNIFNKEDELRLIDLLTEIDDEFTCRNE